MHDFIHLRSHSDYSLGKSIVKIPSLVAHAKKSGMSALCLMDYGNLFGSLEFSIECLKHHIKPIIGVIIKIGLHDRKHGIQLPELSLIAKNPVGYQNLLALVSASFLKNQSDEPHILLESLFNKSEGLIALFNPFSSPLAHFIKQANYKKAEELLQIMKQHFGNDLFLELIRTPSNKWQEAEKLYLKQAYEHNIPIVAANPIAFLEPRLSEAHDALLCIASSNYILADAREKSDHDHYFKSASEMKALFQDLPEAIENTKLLAIKASVFPETRKPMLPKFSEAIDDEELELEQQALHGLKKRIDNLRYEIDQETYLRRLKFELSVINKMQFPGYFLIVSDFIKWSKNNQIPVGPGRGSGAGSIVAWALEITDLDPIKFNLLFERFLNPERVSMPDFDIDFCQHRRDEVINYVKAKYGDDKVAQIITFGKLQARAVLRDVGRVMQIPYGLVDKICKMVPNNPANPVTLSEAIALDKELRNMRDEDPDVAKLLSISLELEGINRHVSTHAAGIIIADRPLVEVVPLYIDSNSSMQTVQYSLKYADAAGLMKFDFLGLKTLTVISETIKLVKLNRNELIDLNNITYDDAVTYEMLSSGNTLGVFQFEGAGVKDAIKQLKPDCLNDIIALTSLNRPGPMDNIPSYINRKHGKEEPDYIHPSLEVLLKETYGIIIYQEQVMQIAQILAGYTLGEADFLRRAMGKKNKKEMEEQKAIFIDRCINKNNINRERANEIFALIEKFASYGFNKSHAAAYAIISYQTAYLKAHYAPEFLTASMNLDIHDTAKIGMFCHEAKMMGITVISPDINCSDAFFKVDAGNIRYGLAAIKGVGIKAMQEVQKIRSEVNFRNVEDFTSRLSDSINRRMLENMTKAGVFDSIYANRGELFLNLDRLIKHSNQKEDNSQQGLLFGNICNGSEFSFDSQPDWNRKDMLGFEFEAFGFYLAANPLSAYEKQLHKYGILNIEQAKSNGSLKSSYKCKVAGIVSSKKVRSSKRSKYAFLQLTDNTGVLDVSIFNEKLLIENNAILEEGMAIVFEVEMKNDEKGSRITVEKIATLEYEMRSNISNYHIYISDKKAINEIIKRKAISEAIPVKLSVELACGTIVNFALNEPVYITHEEAEKLQIIDGIRIIEN